MSALSHQHLHDEPAGYRFVEATLWPNGPVCHHRKETRRVDKLNGKSTRIGVHKCYACKKPFTVKIGTIFEASHVTLHKWLQAILLMCASKKGFSANQLHRTLGVQLKTAWFMSHRIREAMRSGALAPMTGVVEVDETFIGRKKDKPKQRGTRHKHVFLSLVERGGEVRSLHVANAKIATVVPIVNETIAREARVMTDDALQYHEKLGHFAGHGVVNHSANEYVRSEVHTNTVESYFSVFKRGMRGTYQHCSEKHLHRYLAEFDFRHNARYALGVEDEARARKALRGVAGRRFTYKKVGADGQAARA